MKSTSKGAITQEEFDQDKAYLSKLPLDMQIEFLRGRHEQLTGEKPDTLFSDYSQQAIPVTTEREDDAPEKTGRFATLLSKGKIATTLAAVNAIAFIATACGDAATTPTPEATTTPPPTPTAITEPSPTPTLTPTPEPTPTINTIISDWITQNGDDELTAESGAYNVTRETREIGFTFSQKLFKFITDNNFKVILQTTDKDQTVTQLPTPTPTPTVAENSLDLAANEYNIHFIQGNEIPSITTLFSTIQVQAETIPEQTARIRTGSLADHRTINDTFKQWAIEGLDDDAQAEVLANEALLLAKTYKLLQTTGDAITENGADHRNFITSLQNQVTLAVNEGRQHGFSYTPNEATEELKRTLIAANTLLASRAGAKPTLEDVLWSMDLYREHRRNNTEQGWSIAENNLVLPFSDPTRFNSVHDIIIVQNYLATDDEQREERRERLENDQASRTVLLARADALGFFALPDTALNEHPDWVKVSGLENLNYATTPNTPFSSTASTDFRFSLWPVFLDREQVAESGRAQGESNREKYWELGGERWKVLEQLDVVPTSNALVLDDLAHGRLNELPTGVRYSFEKVKSPFTPEIFNPASLSVKIIDDAMKHRQITSQFDVRTRGFIGNHSSTLSFNYGSMMQKNFLLNEYTADIGNNATAFRIFGRLKNERFRVAGHDDWIFPGRDVIIKPEDVLLMTGGTLWRGALQNVGNNAREAQYDPENWGILCLAPNTAPYRQGVVGNNTVYRTTENGHCVTAGEPWATPLGVELPPLDAPEVKFNPQAPFHYPSYPNSATAPRPMFPFTDGEDDERIDLYRLTGGENSVYGRGTHLTKRVMLKMPVFDEGFSQLPEDRPELLKQFPDIVDAFLEYALEHPTETYRFFEDKNLTQYYPEAERLGWTPAHEAPMRNVFRGPWKQVANTVERVNVDPVTYKVTLNDSPSNKQFGN